MDEKEKTRLLKLYDEVDSDEYQLESNSDSESEAEPFSGDDDRDPDFEPSESELSESNHSEMDDPPLVRNEPEDQPEDEPFINNDAVSFSDEDSDDEWVDNTTDIPDFHFDEISSGIKLHFANIPSPIDVFKELWTNEIMDLLVESTNKYGKALQNLNRPHPKNSRFSSFTETNREELYKFLGLCLLHAQIRFPSIRKIFSYDPLYYHPIFSHTMSGRRFELLLRAFNCTNENEQGNRLNKVSQLLKMLIKRFQEAYSPEEHLSLDESLLLHRGRLSFRQYIKGKKAKYGIKFYELCSPSGYNHNMEIYKGKDIEVNATAGDSKLESLVLRLLEPFLDKGHHVVMDNYYNSVSLSNKLLCRKTHSTGTLRSNRTNNPKAITSKKLKKGEHKWLRKGKVYVSKWKDKREVLCITTKYHPQLIQVMNSYGQEKTKPKEVAEYNLHMSGVDRSDQLTSYYSCPRKSVRWYKKVIFHLLDVTLINSFILYRKVTQSKIKLIDFRESIIKDFLLIPPHNKDGRQFVKQGALNCPRATAPVHQIELEHILEKIPVPDGYKRKSYFLRCRNCSKNSKRGQTSWRCQGCESKPPLCVGKCFENYHKT